ncbi:magnesium transporter CorA family protein [Methylocella silvestris]|uniref:Magnesium transport protein CorA n=1 Tax=Methylocella silvestris TaxID=199596 RepID=A0A2J7TJJ8_METSI|nr:magnesium transporter CorA family protein [Methylocella silvestris]PNG26907.1 magnesium transporter CorA [Methylocella silvestris]
MLIFHSTVAKGKIETDLDASVLPQGVNWIDAFRPDAREVAYLQRTLNIVVPTLERLSEIETSSRLYRDKDHLFMSMPMIVRAASGQPQTSPLGFVLCKDYMLTIRYKQIKACEDLHYADIVENRRTADGSGAFITLLEAIIDRAADELEKINAELDVLSQSVFGTSAAIEKRGPEQASGDLRRQLTQVGRFGDLTSKISDVLLGMSRLLPFVTSEAADYLGPDQRAKLKSLGRDISSLNEYETRQTDKIQFLLDATLGFTNIEQNNIFRILTIVSVVGIPPTLFAGIYGMNFKNMPELDWPYGYAYGLAVILISALVPFLWFKKRGWW